MFSLHFYYIVKKVLTPVVIFKNFVLGIEVIAFPSNLPKKAKMLIKKLCRTFPSERLGCQREGVKAIMSHPWYDNFDWEKLRHLEIEAPYKPVLSNNTDTRHFDIFTTNSSEPPDNFGDWDKDF